MCHDPQPFGCLDGTAFLRRPAPGWCGRKLWTWYTSRMSPYNEVRVRFLKLHCLESVIPQEHVLQLPAHSGISFPLVISHRQPHNSESSLSPSGVFLIFQYHCNQGVCGPHDNTSPSKRQLVLLVLQFRFQILMQHL